MRYLSDDRFWKGILVASSGSLYPQISRQLADALAYLQAHGEQICEMVQAEPYLTFIFLNMPCGTPSLRRPCLSAQTMHESVGL